MPSGATRWPGFRSGPPKAGSWRCALLRLLAEVVSKNGNLLLNIGPREDGTIADWLSSRLLDLGRWLRITSRACGGPEPWTGIFVTPERAARST
ncbi:alpha-L-fucosidase [Amycolatopsis rubida]|uniref:alpha-L-fucosidase n=1 Tax=Amycolatopsis rubida TaxID=112413 RepID=UPI000BA2EA26